MIMPIYIYIYIYILTCGSTKDGAKRGREGSPPPPPPCGGEEDKEDKEEGGGGNVVAGDEKEGITSICGTGGGKCRRAVRLFAPRYTHKS